MSQLSFTPTGDLEVIPSKTSSNNDFDFLVGEWKIRNKKLKTRLNNCAEDVFEGKPIVVVFQWDKTNPDSPIWSQAFSPDNGATWEWNWYMTFSRLE